MKDLQTLENLRKELRANFGFTKSAFKEYVSPLLKHQLFSKRNAPQHDVFMMAFIFGHKHDYVVETKNSEMNRNIRREIFTTEDLSIILSVVLAQNVETQDYKILNDMKNVSDIMEHYVNGGIKLLYDFVFKTGGDLLYHFLKEIPENPNS